MSARKVILSLLLLGGLISADAAKPKDWAQYGRYAHANSLIKVAPEVVFMGNSITDFWVGNDSIFFSKNNFVDRGISGQTTVEMLARFHQDVISLSPKGVIILAGINDIAQNIGYISDENILGNIISMAELAKQNNIKVMLCSILPCDRFGWNPDILPAERVKKVNSMIKDYADKSKITYVDYYSEMATKSGGLPEEIAPDHCHPNKAGYLIMEKIAVKGIAKALGTKESRYHVSR